MLRNSFPSADSARKRFSPIFNPGERSAVKIVADANVLLSAVIGGRARLVLNHPDVEEVFTTEATFAEVREYAFLLGRKKKLAPDTILLTVAALPVTIISTEVCADAMAKARRLIDSRDPDDVEILALTLH